MNDFDGLPRGAYVELQDLVRLRLVARELSLAPLLRVRTTTAGLRQSRHRGRGVDFDEVRIYQPGDDVRTIDWRVTARTSKVHTKVFREEKERPVFVLVDQRRKMFFGSKRCCKSVQAAWIAALICWISLQRGDQIGGMVLGETGVAEIRPRRSHHTVLRLLKEIYRYNRLLHNDMGIDSPHNMSRTLSELRRALHPGTLLFVISDCNDMLGETAIHLHNLARHCEICLLRVFDVLEQALPPSGDYLFTDGKQRIRLTSNRGNQNRFNNQRLTWHNELTEMVNNLRIAMTDVDTASATAGLFRTGRKAGKAA